MKSKVSILGLLMLLMITCVPPPELPPEPKIETIQVNSTDLVKGVDSLIISFKFEDGDGDIGVKEEDADLIEYISSQFGCIIGELGDKIDPIIYPNIDTVIGNVFLTDSRDGCMILYNTPYINPQSKHKTITGEILVEIGSGLIDCFPGKLTDTLTYTILLRDRKGNYSNSLTTPKIIIHCN